jgi:hypothetical protein
VPDVQSRDSPTYPVDVSQLGPRSPVSIGNSPPTACVSIMTEPHCAFANRQDSRSKSGVGVGERQRTSGYDRERRKGCDNGDCADGSEATDQIAR